MAVLHRRIATTIAALSLVVHAPGCSDDEMTGVSGGAGGSGGSGGTDAAKPDDTSGNGGGPGSDQFDCPHTEACAACVAERCCPTDESCGGWVEQDWGISHDWMGRSGVVQYRAYECGLHCLPECYAKYRKSRIPEESSLNPDETVRACARECEGAAAWSPFNAFRPYAEAFFACVAPAGSIERYDGGPGGDLGCLAECVPQALGEPDADAGAR